MSGSESGLPAVLLAYRSLNFYAGPANHVVSFLRQQSQVPAPRQAVSAMRMHHATLGHLGIAAAGLLLATAVTTAAQTAAPNYIISEVFNGGPHGLQYVVRVTRTRAETWDARHPQTLVCWRRRR